VVVVSFSWVPFLLAVLLTVLLTVLVQLWAAVPFGTPVTEPARSAFPAAGSAGQVVFR
jgi:nitrogen fixation/metabolism regulation signal transduction histidine kinase